MGFLVKLLAFSIVLLMEKEVENSYFFYEEKIPLINVEGQFVIKYGQMMESEKLWKTKNTIYWQN